MQPGAAVIICLCRRYCRTRANLREGHGEEPFLLTASTKDSTSRLVDLGATKPVELVRGAPIWHRFAPCP
eukprot:1367582-Pleurochrysis_carterae.AAC.1